VSGACCFDGICNGNGRKNMAACPSSTNDHSVPSASIFSSCFFSSNACSTYLLTLSMIPNETHVNKNDVPPILIMGKVRPVAGTNLHGYSYIRKCCDHNIQSQTHGQHGTKRFWASCHQTHSSDHQPQVYQQRKHSAYKSILFTYDGINKICISIRQQISLNTIARSQTKHHLLQWRS
jgi:hypothetical protein